MNESESTQLPGASFLDLKFEWNGQAAAAARGIFWGMEYPRSEYAVGMEPPYKGIEVVQLSPFPYRLPHRMRAKSIDAYLEPSLSTEAGVLKISISWNESPTAMQDWLENGLYSSGSKPRAAYPGAEYKAGWVEDLGGARPVNLRIQIKRVTRDFKDGKIEMDTALLAKAVLSKSSHADVELTLPAMVAHEEWLELECPEFSISLHRPKSIAKLHWSNREFEDVDSGAGINQAPQARQKSEGSGKRPFWQFWKRRG